MIALLSATTLALVARAPWVLPAAAEGNSLKPPYSTEVYIIDDNFTLMWNISSESVGNVTFSADYQIPKIDEDDWMQLPGCQRVVGTQCSFSSPSENVYEEIKLRIRAEKGNDTSSWHKVDPFMPFQKAQIGPPKVYLAAEDKAIMLYISPPGTKDTIMWALDSLAFVYNVVIWKNSSSTEERTETVKSKDKIYRLSPETTYCLKVSAKLPIERKVGVFSPVYCINTTVENKLPSPKNVEINAGNLNYVLKWDYTLVNVTFQAQRLPGHLKRMYQNHSHKWEQIPNCINIKTTQCVFPRTTFPKGIYFLRVQASDGNSTSFWSEEKKFNTAMYTVIFPPFIDVKAVNSSLRVFISDPKESAKQSSSRIYEIVFWENSSNTETKHLEEKNDFTINNLQPLTVYCFKVRAHTVDKKQNASSDFSDTVCQKTKPGNSSKIWVIAGICLGALFLTVVVYVLKYLLRCVNDVFFPSLKPPSNIDKYLHDQPLKNLLLSTFEEQTEKCFIIENTNMTGIETSQIDEDHKKYSSQSSQDSGNYSNEDENIDSQASEELLPQESVPSEGNSINY